MFTIKRLILSVCIALIGFLAWNYPFDQNPVNMPVETLTAPALLKSYSVEVNAVGELEAARSTSIASSISGENTKIIAIVQDGSTVKPGDLLVKLDPTPYELKIADLKLKIADQETSIEALKKNLEWELSQSDIEKKIAAMEIEGAQLELDKITLGDGPMEIARLKSAMQKALSIHEELEGYTNELLKLESEGFVNRSEIKQSQKKLDEAKEALDTANQQYDNYSQHVYPMLVKKGESQIKRAKVKQEETIKATAYRTSKAKSSLAQAEQQYKELLNQLKWAELELVQTEIKAPTPGMVVLREEYRQGQRRKPRIGDIALKNQVLLELPDLQTLIVKSKIREVDLHKIAIGKQASVTVDAYPAKIFRGAVTQIGVLAITDTQRFGEEKYFEVQIALEAKDEALRPGMTARVTVHADEVVDSLSIPVQSVFEIKKQSYCYVQKEGGFCLTPISLGTCNEYWMEVKSGLNEGDSVALSTPLPSQIMER